MSDANREYEIKKLRLEPGDIAVLSTDLNLSFQQAQELRERFRQEVGTDNPVLVLSSGLKLSVLTRAQIEDMAQ